jgi:hypothetical protein
VLIGLSVNRDGTERGAFDFHGLILVSKRTKVVPIALDISYSNDAMMLLPKTARAQCSCVLANQ